jgi:hypothetical protein
MLSMVQVLVAVFGTTDRTSSSSLRTVVARSGADNSIISARLIMRAQWQYLMRNRSWPSYITGVDVADSSAVHLLFTLGSEDQSMKRLEKFSAMYSSHKGYCW